MTALKPTHAAHLPYPAHATFLVGRVEFRP